MFSFSGHTPSAKRFILHVLHLLPQYNITVQQAIVACSVIGVSANNARVALARLCSAGSVVLLERGCYALSPTVLEQMANPAALGLLGLDDTASAMALAMPSPVWSGDYLMVYASKPLLHRSWLLAVGFRQLEPSLFVRPNTLAWTLLGLEAQAKNQSQAGLGRVFVVAGVDGKTAKSIQALYPLKRLEQGYRHCIKALEKGNDSLAVVLQKLDGGLPSDKVLQDCYALLERCDVLVQQDPCLPAEWLDIGLRSQCVDLRCALYQKAQQLWLLRLQG